MLNISNFEKCKFVESNSEYPEFRKVTLKLYMSHSNPMIPITCNWSGRGSWDTDW